MKCIIILIAGIAFASTSVVTVSRAAEPPAASRAFISQDVIVLQARDLMSAGKFKQAEELLARPDPGGAPEALQSRKELADIIQRTRQEYSLDAAGLLAKVKKTVSDATAQEVEHWAKESRARFLSIDGTNFYFRREPQNIFLFSETAQARRAAAGKAPTKTKFNLIGHLARVIEEAERTGNLEVQPVRHQITHTLTIPANHASLQPGSVVKVWLPFPQEYRQQHDVKLVRASPQPKLIAPSSLLKNV